jgi:lipopolysaccharide export system protein LptA
VRRIVFAGALFAALSIGPALQAQQATTTVGSGQLEVTADNGIEWNKDKKTYVARGNAMVKRGNFSVRAATLTAHYRDKDGGKSEIYKVGPSAAWCCRTATTWRAAIAAFTTSTARC